VRLSMLRRLSVSLIIVIAIGAAVGTYWIAHPSDSPMHLEAPLQAWAANDASVGAEYGADMAALIESFRPQAFRSFCGPASMATVLRAYGVSDADQKSVFGSVLSRLDTFYSGMSLDELGTLARQARLLARVVYADTLDAAQFRELLKSNLARAGDFVLVNYDRRVLKQSGAGHISPIAAYDPSRDAFLVLDEAAYRYPFTWVPAALLYAAAHTRAGDHYRGLLLVEGMTTGD
jgi:hypothetical protein